MLKRKKFIEIIFSFTVERVQLKKIDSQRITDASLQKKEPQYIKNIGSCYLFNINPAGLTMSGKERLKVQDRSLSCLRQSFKAIFHLEGIRKRDKI